MIATNNKYRILLAISVIGLVLLGSSSSGQGSYSHYLVKPLYIFNANTVVVDNLITYKLEKVVIARTELVGDRKIDLQAVKLIHDFCFHGDVCTLINYGHDEHGRIVGDFKHLDGIQELSYLLIVNGLVYWYEPFNPHDTAARECEERAKLLHVGVWGR